ncbi:LytR family transcriptional regulator [Fredinandcohnia onubensis]|uniref:LytR family transcriptional regulator n=1 Tax=Fredinandcohnia onubensis TaxID=1571209 RepID=UPI000C0BF370|nr:LytR family transcriptional regulator [Fredinandcohnia onubensis]
MSIFSKQPKSVKKTLRYIQQDVQSVEKLEEIQKVMNVFIKKRREQLLKHSDLQK